MIPKYIDKEELLEIWGDQDVKQANTDIEDILSKLSPEQREQVLNHVKGIEK